MGALVGVDGIIDLAPYDAAEGDNHEQEQTKDKLLPGLEIEHGRRKAEVRKFGEHVF